MAAPKTRNILAVLVLGELYQKTGSGIFGLDPLNKRGTVATGLVASGVAAKFHPGFAYGDGISPRTASASDAATCSRAGGSMTAPYGTIEYGAEDYGDGWYGGFRNDGQRVATGTDEPIFAEVGSGVLGGSASGFYQTVQASGSLSVKSETAQADLAASAEDATVYDEEGTARSTLAASAVDAPEIAKEGTASSGRAADGSNDREIGRTGTGALNAVARGIWRPPTIGASVSIEEVLTALQDSREVVLTLVED